MTSFESLKLILELVLAVLVTPLGVVLWYMLRKVVTDVRHLERHSSEYSALAEKSLSEFKLHAAETYSTKGDLSKAIEQFSRSIDAVFAKLERIEDKLDLKADKAAK